MSKFSKLRGIDNKTAFAWWLHYKLRKRNVIISSINTCISKTTHKYGINIPVNIKPSFNINEKNHNIFWKDALKKEMHNFRTTFEILKNDTSPWVGWEKVTSPLIFDVKMDLSQNSWWVMDGHKTLDPI